MYSSLSQDLIQDQQIQPIQVDSPRESIIEEKGEDSVRGDIASVEEQSRVQSRSRSKSREQRKYNSSRSSRYYDQDHRYERRRGRDYSRSPDRREGGWDNRRIRYMIPMLDGPLISLRQFMDLQTDKVDSKKAEQHYLQYKKSWEKRQNEIFVKEHMEEAWFKEKYDSFISEQIQNEKALETQKIAEDFFKDYSNNVFDSIQFDITDAVIQEIQQAQDTNANNDDQTKDGSNTGTTVTAATTTTATTATADEQSQSQSQQNPSQTEQKTTQVQVYAKIFVGDNFDVTASPYFGFDPVDRTLFIKTIPKDLGRQDIFDVIQKVPGFQSFSVSEPVPSQMFQRYGWIVFDSFEKCAYACERFKNDCLVINKQELNIVKNSQKRMVKVAKRFSLKKSLTDYATVLRLIASLDSTKGITTNPLLELDPVDFSFKNLDTCLLYLRRVHAYCYYSGAHCNDERMLVSKCGSAYLRLRNNDILMDELTEEVEPQNTDMDWQDKAVEIAVNKIAEIEQMKTQLKGVALFKERLAHKIIFNVKKLMKGENGAWPCIYCAKKFKDSEFIVKHIDNKHSSEEKYLNEIEKMRAVTILEQYSMDKNKITHTPPNKDGFVQNRNRRFGQSNSNNHHNNSSNNRDRDNKQYGQRRQSNGGHGHGHGHHDHNNNNHGHGRSYGHGHGHGHGQHRNFKDLDDPEPSNNTIQTTAKSHQSINYLEI